MPRCKNDPTRSYKGDEPSPKGLGFCAKAEEAGKIMTGLDGERWQKIGTRWQKIGTRSRGTGPGEAKRRKQTRTPHPFDDVPAGAKPLTLDELRKRAFAVERGRLLSVPIDVYWAQEGGSASRHTMLFSGAAVHDGFLNKTYDGKFVEKNRRQARGQHVWLTAMAKDKDNKKENKEKAWTSVLVQVCDGNYLALSCVSEVLIYAA